MIAAMRTFGAFLLFACAPAVGALILGAGWWSLLAAAAGFCTPALVKAARQTVADPGGWRTRAFLFRAWERAYPLVGLPIGVVAMYAWAFSLIGLFFGLWGPFLALSILVIACELFDSCWSPDAIASKAAHKHNEERWRLYRAYIDLGRHRERHGFYESMYSRVQRSEFDRFIVYSGIYDRLARLEASRRAAAATQGEGLTPCS